MTNYILDHSTGRAIVMIYENSSGITERVVHVTAVTATLIKALDAGKPKTFRRDRILSASWLHGSSTASLPHANTAVMH